MTQIAVSHPCTTASRIKGNWLQRLFAVARQRRELARLDDRALKDIGVTRRQASTEAARPFWDAPDNWYRCQ